MAAPLNTPRLRLWPSGRARASFYFCLSSVYASVANSAVIPRNRVNFRPLPWEKNSSCVLGASFYAHAAIFGLVSKQEVLTSYYSMSRNRYCELNYQLKATQTAIVFEYGHALPTPVWAIQLSTNKDNNSRAPVVAAADYTNTCLLFLALRVVT